MSSQQYARKQSSWQPDRSQTTQKTDPSLAPKSNKPLEIANVAPGGMLDNVMRAMTNQETPATPPREFVQPKLTIGQPHDRYEQEADRTAKQVVQSIRASESPTLANKTHEEPSLQCKAEAFQQIWRPILQAKGDEGGTTSDEFDRTLNHAKSGGQPLDSNLQRSMGAAMGADFSGVKVHADSTANNLSESIQAKAFTTGRDVFFKRGAYQPNAKNGQELIAHELTHVVQQTGSVQRQGDGVIQRTIVEHWGDSAKEVNLEDAVKYLLDREVPEDIAWRVVQQFAPETKRTTDLQTLYILATMQDRNMDMDIDEKATEMDEKATEGDGRPALKQSQGATGGMNAEEVDSEGIERTAQVGSLIVAAHIAADRFAALLNGVVNIVNKDAKEEICTYEGYEFITKTVKSAQEKAERIGVQWGEGVAYALMDVLRGTISCKSERAIHGVQDLLGEKLRKEVAEQGVELGINDLIKDSYNPQALADEEERGYGDIKYYIPMGFERFSPTKPDQVIAGGVIFGEVQVLHAGLLDLKKHGGHAFYDITRACKQNEDGSYTVNASKSGVADGANELLNHHLDIIQQFIGRNQDLIYMKLKGLANTDDQNLTEEEYQALGQASNLFYTEGFWDNPDVRG